MDFTYQSYRTLLQALRENSYSFQTYHEAQNVFRWYCMVRQLFYQESDRKLAIDALLEVYDGWPIFCP